MNCPIKTQDLNRTKTGGGEKNDQIYAEWHRLHGQQLKKKFRGGKNL